MGPPDTHLVQQAEEKKMDIFDFDPTPGKKVEEMFVENHRIRLYYDAEENPWFTAKDVAISLGYANPQQAVRALEEEDREILEKIQGAMGQHLRGNAKNTILINETGLYELVFSSTKPFAKAFRRWVCKEVLPAIRKYGKFELEQRAIALEDENRRLKQKRIALGRENTNLEGKIENVKPRVVADIYNQTYAIMWLGDGNYIGLRGGKLYVKGQIRIKQKNIAESYVVAQIFNIANPLKFHRALRELLAERYVITIHLNSIQVDIEADEMAETVYELRDSIRDF